MSSAPSPKRQKTCIEDDLVCPITLELPFDPVMAEDGRVYEREAIAKHFENKKIRNIKSPVTNKTMGVNLIAAIQTKNHIETLINKSVITGDLVDKWKARAQEKEKMEELLRKAEEGDIRAMHNVGRKYYYGSRGFPKDAKLAYHWLLKAKNAGSVISTALVGEALLNGTGVAKDVRAGTFYLTEAASKGSTVGAYYIGMAWAKGMHGFSIDKMEAVRWLKLSVDDNSDFDHLKNEFKQKAQEMINELLNEST